jgi:hypothetical protein
MSKHVAVSCHDCYFRRAGLCALPGDTPCPTFRPAGRVLTPPGHAPLVPRPLSAFAAH